MHMRNTRGLTLLEVMVALVILSLVGLAYLELFHQSHRIAADSRQWATAVGYAEDAMERVKLQGAPAQVVVEDLPDGFKRQTSAQLWKPGLSVVEVTVGIPGGRKFDLHRLVQLEPTIARATTETGDEGM
jgi:prepilin-type N-terminal cleavage/methylation domain-containing protein